MAKFFIPTPNFNIYRYAEHVNKPVNLDLVFTFFKYQEKYYPDNTVVPAICLEVDRLTIYWYYNNEAERDNDYERLLNVE